jgi:hypothetical protein
MIDRIGKLLIELGALSPELYKRINDVKTGSIAMDGFNIKVENGQIVEFKTTRIDNLRFKIEPVLEKYQEMKKELEEAKKRSDEYVRKLTMLGVILDILPDDFKEFKEKEAEDIDRFYYLYSCVLER